MSSNSFSPRRAGFVRARPGLIIVEHRLGLIMANAGIDLSNTGAEDGREAALLLPIEPDLSAANLQRALADAYGTDVGVIISDSFGRPWRSGTTGVAIGAAGLPGLLDLRGEPDLDGRPLLVSISGFADEIAAGGIAAHGTRQRGPSDRRRPRAQLDAVCDECGRPDASAGTGPVSMSGRVEKRVVALSGGIGGAKLALGLSRVLVPEYLTIIANTGDDFEHLDLEISPDIDTLMYTLADLANPEAGWGRRDETWSFMETVRQLGGADWFNLGDRDLAVHVERTRRLESGERLTAVTADFCTRFGVASRILPMSDDPRSHGRRDVDRRARVPGLFRASAV